jgi:NADPH:quinone reductase-like Zn-dependent oxidoreductase
MRAATHATYGPPSVLHIDDVPRPTPIGDQVLVAVHHSTVTRSDIAFRAGKPYVTRAVSGLRRPKHTITGSEFAGVVAEIGADVTQFAVGDRVFGANVRTYGAHAEFMTIPEGDAITKVPDGVSLAGAAAVPDGVVLALPYLRWADLGPQHRILVYGASGSIGTAAVQLAKHEFGAHVTAVCTAETLELARSLGADEVLDHRVTDFTKIGETYDIVFDAVGKRTFRECRRLLVPKGVFLNTDLGFLWQNPFIALATSRLPMRRMAFPLPHYRKADLELAARMLVAGTYRPVVDRSYPLDEIIAANAFVETATKVGNVVVDVVG